MKKLYRKGTVHPSPPLISDHLSFLPVAILTLASSLSQEDKQVLAYLISCSSGEFSGENLLSGNFSGKRKNTHHVASFNCYCFSCYMSYWVKWDSSPNRQLIHEILDAYEDGLQQSKKEKSKKERRNNNNNKKKSSNGVGSVVSSSSSSSELKKSSSELSLNGSGPGSGSGSGQADPVEETAGNDEEETGGEEGGEKGSVRKFMSYLGEKIWGVWT
ncbi:uncharacterized protein LOC132058819 [Lycium ferocissimum]|uniref:uncharacterized protein LOC132058819 n=1 Tax=Lycium ferocissimum TaxID=112874 RepID=UPI0028149940|nr:uncharacterized protein LOC132058819 [Lycium ferocissimum]